MRLPLEEMCLRIRASGTTDSILSFLTEAIDSPPTKNIERSIKELILVQALDENENLTLLGKVLSSLPVDVRLGKLLLYGVALKCLDPILTIASSLSISKTPFTRPFGNEQLADLSRDSFKSGDSDLLTIVSAFDQWRVVILKQGYSKAKKWCEGKFLSFQSFTQIEESRSQLIKLLASVEGVPSNINTIKRKGVIETSVLSDFNVNSSILRVLQTAIFAALNPNLLMLPTEPDAPKKFCLVQPHSLGYVYPSSQKSAYCNGVLDSPSCWFTFHSLTRVNTGTKSRLGVWDLTKITTMHLLLLSREFKVEHRQGVIEADGVRINCIARTAVCIARFKDILKETLERRIVGKSTLEDEKIVEMMIDLLKS